MPAPAPDSVPTTMPATTDSTLPVQRIHGGARISIMCSRSYATKWSLPARMIAHPSGSPRCSATEHLVGDDGRRRRIPARAHHHGSASVRETAQTRDVIERLAERDLGADDAKRPAR